MYVVQSVMHSIAAGAIAEMALLAWKIGNPALRQRFRIVAIVAAALAFPLYQWAGPARGSAEFRLATLFDSGRWLGIDVFGWFTLGAVFAAVVAMTALVFVVQELIPIVFQLLRSLRESRRASDMDSGIEVEALIDPAVFDKLHEALAGLPIDPEDVIVVEDDYLTLHSSTGIRPSITLSNAIIEEFTLPQLRAALAHEAAHIMRSRRPVLLLVYILRVVMFYNPVAMVEFRRIAQDEEKICDDMAIAMTGEAEGMAEAIEALRPDVDEYAGETERKDIARMAAAVDQYNHDMLLRARIDRIREPFGSDVPLWQGGLSVAIAAAASFALAFFVI